MTSKKDSILSLLPLALFLLIFIGSGIYLSLSGTKMAFYQVSATVAILPALIWALWMGKSPLAEKLDIFVKGVGDSGIITMCLIYLAAGAFAVVTKSIGGVDATVNLGLYLIPSYLLLPGIFIITALVATAMGTSMGTIAAIAPIAVGLAAKTTLGLPLLMGTVVGGAMFGDNMSIISDTTIAATRTQGCEMRDKFIFNFKIAVPTAILTCIILFFQGETSSLNAVDDFEIIKVVPYILILAMALIGINVFVVLVSGTLFAGAIGLATVSDFTLVTLSQQIYSGFSGMQEILVLTLLIGGLAKLIEYHGGIRFVILKINGLAMKLSGSSTSPRWGQGSIAILVSLVNMCTANNTVAILISGKIAKELAAKNHIDSRRSASLLDIFSCAIQGLIPYGAQVLLAGSIAGISPLSVTANMFYCYLLMLAGVIAIITRPTK